MNPIESTIFNPDKLIAEAVDDDWEVNNLRAKILRWVPGSTIREDGTIDVDGGASIQGWMVDDEGRLKVKFGNVDGIFYADDCGLTSLEGCPDVVKNTFYCSHNQKLTSLDGGPFEVGNSYLCEDCGLTTLEGAPHEIQGVFDCSNNDLISLDGAPRFVGGLFNCLGNPLKSLKGRPQTGKFGSIRYDDDRLELDEGVLKNVALATAIALAPMSVDAAAKKKPEIARKMEQSLAQKIKVLIPALIRVESSGNDKARGDNNRAFGCLQLHPEYVEDVNRFAGTHFTHEDAFDRKKAIEITTLYLMHYGKKLGENATLEALARMHNGGYRGPSKLATLGYWKKVKNHLV